MAGFGVVVLLSPLHPPRAAPEWSEGPAPPPSSGFHLGTAAGPFGWSSAVADFDDDGRLDFAVADRVGPPADGGYRYRIEFAVTGIASRSIAFESPSPALIVAIEDVDQDQDLDIVVADAASSTVETVWLNDGHGRFVAHRAEASPRRRLAFVTLDATPDTVSPAPGLLVRVWGLDAVTSEGDVLDASGPVSALAEFAGTSPSAAAAPSRAPPRARSTSSI